MRVGRDDALENNFQGGWLGGGKVEARHLDGLLACFGIQMEERGIDIRIESGLQQIGLRYVIPAFATHINLDCWVSRYFVLLVDLAWGRRRCQWQSLHNMAFLASRSRRLRL